jgi:hypothetical protein
MKVVTWKDEGDCGPCTIYDNAEEVGRLLPYGEPYPDTIHKMGWMTKGEARKLAKKMKAEFREF